MKSKILSFSLLRDTLKQQLWVLAVSCICFLLVYPVRGISAMESWSEYKELTLPMKQDVFAEFCIGDGLQYILLVCAMVAILSALVGFSYLHSANKTDFYHSFPIKRERLFINQLAASVIIYLIPALITMMLLMIVGAFQGVLTLAAFGSGLLSILMGLLYYLLCFAVAALAMILTGRIMVGVLGAGVLFGGSMIARWVLEAYESIFFWTYSGDSGTMSDALQALTPIGWLFYISEGSAGVSRWIYTGLLIPINLLLLSLGIYVYRRRKSEAAGSSMAFPKAATVIEVFLVVLCSLISGLFFRHFAAGGHTARWLSFGLVFGLILSYGIIQMIYYLDIRTLMKGKLIFLISVILTAGFVCIAQFDLLKYNSYLPKQDEVSDINIQLGDAKTVSDESAYYTIFSRFTGFSHVSDLAEEGQSGMGNGDDVYIAAQLLIAESERVHEASENYTDSVQVVYVLDSGRTVVRNYGVNWNYIKDDLHTIFNDKKCLDYCYPIRTEKAENVGEIYLSYIEEADRQLFSSSDSDRIAFTEALQEDMRQLNSQIITEETPVGCLTLNVKKSRGGNMAGSVEEQIMLKYGVEKYKYISEYSTSMQTWIYPSYTRTLKALENMGYHLTSEINSADVKSITIYDYSETDQETAEKKYTDAKDIEEICPYLIFSNLVTDWSGTLENTDAYVEFKDGTIQEIYCNIRADIPREFFE